MKKEDIIQIPANLEAPGFKIKCRYCKTWVKKCMLNGKDISLCPHQNKLQYISVIKVPGEDKREVRILESRNLYKALELYAKHRREVKEKNSENTRQIITHNTEPNESKGLLLTDLMAVYLDYLSGENVPLHKKKIRSSKHRKEVSKVFEYFAVCLKRNNGEVSNLSIDDINDFTVGKFHQDLENRRLSARSYNKYMGIMKSFFAYLNRERYTTNNPFIGFVRKDLVYDPQTITRKEFEDLRQAFQNPELGKQQLSSGKIRNWHKAWLSQIAEIGLFSGRRLTENFFIKWADVKENENNIPTHIDVIDRKVTNQRGSPNALPKIVHVPVTKDLHEWLLRSGYETKKCRDEYIIAPHEKMAREGMSLHTSKAFTVYFRKISDRHLTFHCLRRTYLTELTKKYGAEIAQNISGHSEIAVMRNHYINSKDVNLVANDFRVFNGELENRKEEIKEIRKQKTEKSIER